ncbi:hypothetical protein [Secundilactobacillus silagei]|uniref:Uncharacterized protein n=1 Tax=Secundilactobacillus silagei JCM 19001 TaxID=1302250 RepID=A0A1Z5IG99_9LACO|nr:hypothetical protein [Secundilactobacillus silagei]TDG73402.1 hypothetical protein C5L25_000551 [Secundilactobacillus silagei JCM 19001]GAX00773.1 hypothetical protein IWT126_00788 [Secundilactobacillus silagei JCM 19001]
MENTKIKPHQGLKAKLTRIVVTLVMLSPLFIIMINASWSNVDGISGAVILILMASIVIGLWQLSKSLILTLQKGADTDYKER